MIWEIYDCEKVELLMRYCGRDFSSEEINWIRQLIANDSQLSRQDISKRLCERVDWRKVDGGLKDMSCRVALLKMHRDGLISLPAPKRKHFKAHKHVNRTLFALPQPQIHKSAGEFDLRVEVVKRASSALWNEFIDRYHYLGYTPLPGAQIRYFVKHKDQILALLGFGAAAWKTAPRDQFIGWDGERRKKNLHLVVNNARFLIVPWVRSENLASRVLSLASRALPEHWEQRYHYRPVLLETFVQKDRFQGTCYKAANWIYVGDTKGRGKLDIRNEYKLPVKAVFVYPLVRNFRQLLLQGAS